MSEPVARKRPTLDLNEFEKRLRSGQTTAGQARDARTEAPTYDDDPLSEMARLVGNQHDPYGDVFAREAIAQYPAQDTRRDPVAAPPPRRLSGDFAAIEAGLRGAFAVHDDAPEAPAYPDDQGHYTEGHDDRAWTSALPPQASHRAGRPVFAMVATIAIGVIGIGVAFAYKGASSSPREIKTIMAAAGPTKVQPPMDTVTPEGQDATAAKSQDVPTKVVSREEQPVDLSQAVQENAARDAAADAASVTVPLAPSQAGERSPGPAASPDYSTLGGPSATSSAGTDNVGFGAGIPATKRVKVVSVKPDGTIVPSPGDVQSADGAPSMTAPTMPLPTLAEPSAIPARAPKATKNAKTTSRVTASKPMSINAASGDDTTGNETPKPAKVAKVKKAKPVKVATAETETPDSQQATQAPSQDATPSTSGRYAVQLAAPGSEAEAKSASARLGEKFADTLGGRHLGYRKVEGKSIYRVRVGSLTKDDALSLCSKLKANGGACFVAKN